MKSRGRCEVKEISLSPFEYGVSFVAIVSPFVKVCLYKENQICKIAATEILTYDTWVML